MRSMKFSILKILSVLCVLTVVIPACAFAASPVATFDPSTTTFAFPTNGTYAFAGTFTNDLVISVPAGMNITLDGSGADFQCNVELNFPRIAGNANEMTATPRSGSYVIENFQVSKSLNVGSCQVEQIEIKNNKMAGMELNCSNSKVILTGNTINNTGEAKRHNSTNTHKNGLLVYADNYDIVLNNNTITSALRHAIEVVGQHNWQSAAYDNSWSITNNTLTGAQTAFKIYNDKTYAPVEWPEEYQITDEMKALAEQIMEKNTLPEGVTWVDVLVRKNGGTDLNATEKTYPEFQEIAETIKAKKDEPVAVYVPKTGDSSNLMLWAALMIVAAMGMVVSRKRLSAGR